MRRAKAITLTFLFFGLAILCNGQNPGYLGKKFILSSGISGAPVIGSLLVGENLNDFNFHFSSRIEYIVKYNISLGLIYERLSDIIYLDNYSSSSQSPMEQYANGSFYSDIDKFKSAAYFTGNNIGFFIKRYNFKNFGSIAPFGTYLYFEICKNHISVSDDGRFYNNEQTKLHTINTGTAIFGFGKQNIYFDRLTFDYSFNFGLNFAGVASIGLDEDKGHDFTSAEAKLFSDYIFFIKINLGWLVF